MNRRTFALSLLSSFIALPALRQFAHGQTFDSALTGGDPLAAAEYLSSLENIEHIPALYTLYAAMHPDAQQIIDRATVIGWYQADFQPLGPKQAVATSSRRVNGWVWAVTGQAYDVDEVSFTQEFADGSVVNDVVRLATVDGRFAWFFGRDANWVQEQRGRFSSTTSTVPQQGSAPRGLDILEAIPDTPIPMRTMSLADGTEFKPFEREGDDGSGVISGEHGVIYANPKDMYPVGAVVYGELVAPGGAADSLLTIIDDAENRPPFVLEAWNAAPEHGLPWAKYTSMGSEAIGMVTTVILTDGERTLSIGGSWKEVLNQAIDLYLAQN